MKKMLLALPLLLGFGLFSLNAQTFASAEWTKHPLIAHALGGIDHTPYTNSYEAFETNYANGQRVFEVDLQFTSDGYLVGRHDWSKYAFDTLGQELPPGKTGGPLTLAELKASLILGRYYSLEFSEIVDLLREHPDAYIVTDTKSLDKDTITDQFKTIYTLAEEDDNLLTRVIPQIYNESMYGTIENVYPFQSYIYTLYQTLDSDQKVLDFVKNHKKIDVVTMPPERARASFVAKLKTMNKLTYIHTINTPQEIESYKAKGIYGFYTDFVTPDDLKEYEGKLAQQRAKFAKK